MRFTDWTDGDPTEREWSAFERERARRRRRARAVGILVVVLVASFVGAATAILVGGLIR